MCVEVRISTPFQLTVFANNKIGITSPSPFFDSLRLGFQVDCFFLITKMINSLSKLVSQLHRTVFDLIFKKFCLCISDIIFPKQSQHFSPRLPCFRPKFDQFFFIAPFIGNCFAFVRMAMCKFFVFLNVMHFPIHMKLSLFLIVTPVFVAFCLEQHNKLNIFKKLGFAVSLNSR